jgi:uncharacterized protein (DUF1697 family)
MPRFVAFLRAINVGGHVVTMDRLRALFESRKFQQVETFIASGNVIFNAREPDVAKLELVIEAQLLDALGYEVKTFVRGAAEVARISRACPFDESRVSSAGAFCVGFLARPLTADERELLFSLKTQIDDFHIDGREFYWICQKRQSDSKFSNVVFERKVKLRTTIRGLSTMQKLAKKLGDREG